MELSASNAQSHRKEIQNMHETIREVDVTVLIVKNKPECDEEEITEKNEIGVGVKAKWMNFTESIPKHLCQTCKFLPNGKRIYSKFRLTHKILAEDIIMTLKEALEECNVCAKLQPMQHWNV